MNPRRTEPAREFTDARIALERAAPACPRAKCSTLVWLMPEPGRDSPAV